MKSREIDLDLQHSSGSTEENVTLSHFLTNVILPGDVLVVHCDHGKTILDANYQHHLIIR